MTIETALKAIRDFDVREYVEGYEFRGDGDYTPNEREMTLIEDAVMGAVGVVEERVRASLAAAPASAAKQVTFEKIAAILDGIDRMETGDDFGGWWETSVGEKFGSEKLAAIKRLFEPA